MKGINKISFTSGTIEKLTFDYYTLTLFNGAKKVYAATIGRLNAAELIDKHDNKKITLVS